jgi:hypothetical protein
MLHKILLLFSVLAFATVYGQVQSRITLDITETPVTQVMKQLQEAHGLNFYYSSDLLNLDQRVTIRVRNARIEAVCKQLFRDLGIQWDIRNEGIILSPDPAFRLVLNGYIKDSLSGEDLIGAIVQNTATGEYTTTNTYGYFSFSTGARGTYTLLVFYPGYKSRTIEVSLHKSRSVTWYLPVLEYALSEVTVMEGRQFLKDAMTGKNTLSAEQIKSIVSITGEPDLLKGLQLLPGIQTSNEGTTGLSVRGGNTDQNLVLLDEAPVYNASHSLGFFSAFNPDAIKQVQVYKGFYPSNYGGRLSSVIDISMKEGNNQRMKISGGMGLLASRLTLEGPLKRNKSAFIISSRYGYAGPVISKVGGAARDFGMPSLNNFSTSNDITFYDINAKMNFTIGLKDRLYVSSYFGRDHFYSLALYQNNTMDWGNQTFSARWNHLFSHKLFSNLTLYYSNYEYAYSISDDLRKYKWEAGIQEAGLKYDFQYTLNSKNRIKTGAQSSLRYFKPGSITPSGPESVISPFELEHKKGIENGVYINNEQTITPKLMISYGLRYSDYISLGPGTSYTYDKDYMVADSSVYSSGQVMNIYHGLEPRLLVRYMLTDRISVKSSYSYNKQYMQLISNSTVGLPTDMWYPSDNNIRPQGSHQLMAGIYLTFAKDKLEWSSEAYYKTLSDIIDYKDNADLFLNKHIDAEVRSGNGISYGWENMLEKRGRKFTAQISYTLAKTQYSFNGINHSRAYSPTFDIRHNLSIFANWKITERWSLNATFKYTSGRYITVPEGIFMSDYTIGIPYYSERNAYRLPAYHRLDLMVQYRGRHNATTRWKDYWALGVYNAYNRKNPFAVYTRPETGNMTRTSQMYISGIVPTISYNFEF